MERLVLCYDVNLRVVRSRLRVEESFDIIERRLTLAGKEVSFFYIDGFVKDGEMLRLMQFFLSEKRMGTAEEMEKRIPYVEVERTSVIGKIIKAVGRADRRNCVWIRGKTPDNHMVCGVVEQLE